MIDAGTKDNIKKLRKKYKEDPEDLALIDTWEADLKRLSEQDDFSNLPTTKSIVAKLKERITAIVRERALSKTLTLEDIKLLDVRRDENEKMLALFIPNFSEEIKMLEDKIVEGLAP